MYEDANQDEKTKVLQNIFKQKDKSRGWQVDINKPFFAEAVTRGAEDSSTHRHKGRSRLLVEAEMGAGGLVSIY